MEENKEMKPNYKIWHFGKSKWDRVLDEKFYAKNDDEAYAYLKAFKAAKHDNMQHYYGVIHYLHIMDNDMKTFHEIDVDDRKTWKRNSKFKLSRMLEKIWMFFYYWLVDKPRDFYYWCRDTKYLLKNKEAYSNQWNLDWHILDSIERNVPSLIKNSHALAFLDEAILQVHGKEPGFDLRKFHEENCQGYPKDLEELAIKIQNEEYSKLLLHVKLYKYYASFGGIDYDNPEEVAFDKEWRHTLPLKPGTYDMIADYGKMNAIVKEQWNSIWDWMKAYGQKLND